MKILVIGTERDFNEFEKKFGLTNDLTFDSTYQFHSSFPSFDLIFDFFVGDEPELFSHYRDSEGLTIFVNSPKISLAELSYFQEQESRNTVFGFNGLPTFVDREILEVSLLDQDSLQELNNICKAIGTDLEVVNDRVGMVTPRIIAMIINEAFYTVQEGTATKEDVDLGMKLGTNYPYGPFEWCEMIGIQNIYELLEALYEDTKEERYKICPLLKKAYLLA
ncbi:3-hydroxyacyl-CoA dehydrogenase family protein [Roseivirga sp. E12]|uniref:3-hydroxyacyl-CoA dehydrogenase family protein n=1 Tax=Roseivirga sp. E12 TaxID=2819237 RepID=UPI001ABCCB7D|nr:3-hydroxyacyl-CoA dehydrogenase family protein [Roseivirga sp. E12]MBO3699433.1 3-hydroxyacyl-CoA dehydrogenase [Roseivirga sp. E12]